LLVTPLLQRATATLRERSNRQRLSSAIREWADDFLLTMVVVRNIVHVAIPALRLLVPHGSVLVVGNGLRTWERDWLLREFPALSFTELSTSRLRGREATLSHGDVMELVSSVAKGDFGFVDPDCYVFSRDLYSRLTRATKTACMTSPFWGTHGTFGIDVPETYFIGINHETAKRLRRAYGVRFGVTREMPSSLAKDLEIRWPDTDIHPDSRKPYFDTVHGMTLAAATQGLVMERVQTQPGDVFHVCGTSYLQTHFRPEESQDATTLNAHYFHLEVIKRTRDTRVAREFGPMHRYYGGSDGLLRSNPRYARSEDFHTTQTLIDTLVDHEAL
jgi:hypothetical protein